MSVRKSRDAYARERYLNSDEEEVLQLYLQSNLFITFWLFSVVQQSNAIRYFVKLRIHGATRRESNWRLRRLSVKSQTSCRRGCFQLLYEWTTRNVGGRVKCFVVFSECQHFNEFVKWLDFVLVHCCLLLKRNRSFMRERFIAKQSNDRKSNGDFTWNHNHIRWGRTAYGHVPISFSSCVSLLSPLSAFQSTLLCYCWLLLCFKL